MARSWRPFEKCLGLGMLAFLAFLAGGCRHDPSPATAPLEEIPSLAIENVTIIDTRSGAARRGMTVLISGDRITAVLPAASQAISGSWPRLDGDGAFLIPGLWDMHVHTLWDPIVRETFLPSFVANGVTGVRDMGGDLRVLEAIREEGEGVGGLFPRIFAPGPILDGPQPVDPSISWPIADPSAARQAVDRLAEFGVDFIKVYTLLPRPAFEAVMERAGEAGLSVAGHVPFEVGATAAARAGMRSLEHMQSETGGYCSRRDPSTCTELFALFREQRTWQTPTLVVRRARSTVADSGRETHPLLAYIPAELRELWLSNRERKLRREGEEYFSEIRRHFEEEMGLAGKLHTGRVPWLVGSDAGADFSFPGFSLHEELELLTRVGLSPFEALQAATLGAATFLGQGDSHGAVEVGMVADLVLLDADPRADIRNTRRIRGVILGGRALSRAELDQALEEAARAAR